jgi:hypothetical protein
MPGFFIRFPFRVTLLKDCARPQTCCLPCPNRNFWRCGGLEQRASGIGIVLLVFLLGMAVIAPALPAYGFDQDPGYHAGIGNPEIVTINQSEINETALEKYLRSPEPVTVLHAEVREKSLPGPRYMAFGPSVIDISMNPEIFCAFVVMVALCIAFWCIQAIGRWGEER